MSIFQKTQVNIIGNNKLRKPQIEAYLKIENYFQKNPAGEALVVLPTGTGKSGLIAISPFGVSNGRVLILTPNLVTRDSIKKSQSFLDDNFLITNDVIFSIRELPIVNEYSSDLSDRMLQDSHIVYTNIQKTSELIRRVPFDFFDFIIIDESHHSPANSWVAILNHFYSAKKLHVTGTPYRGDNQELRGEKIHETSLSDAMRNKYIKYLRKETVNAHELYFIIPENQEKKYSLEEIINLREDEWIQRSVAMSEECSNDVIEQSLLRLQELNKLSPNTPHKILAVACSIAHAQDILINFRNKGVQSVIVHSNMDKRS